MKSTHHGLPVLSVFEPTAHTDHLGSIVKLTDANGSPVFSATYDAWGKRTVNLNTFKFHRGYTGHEHLPEFDLINMNGRVYSPTLGRFMSADPFVQMPDNSQSYNRYSYCMNNPMKYVDPSGNKWWHWLIGDILTGGALSGLAMTTGLSTYAAIFPFTNQGYELQQWISPIAIKPSLSLGSLQKGIGFDFSIGVPKLTPPSYRYHFGATYYSSSYGGYTGWETRSGGDTQILPFIGYSTTRFKAGEFTQTLGMFTVGPPMSSMKYENDKMPEFHNNLPGMPSADGGDRWRSAAIQIEMGALSINLNMFTGDPGLEEEERQRNVEVIDGHRTYTGGTADKYRAGVFSISFGPLSIGRNSEQIRHVFQNRFAHDLMTGGKAAWFRVLDIAPSWFFSFGTGNGNTLW